jgi:hypothetical protein
MLQRPVSPGRSTWPQEPFLPGGPPDESKPDPHRRPLPRQWRAKLIRSLAPAPDIRTPHPDPGMSGEAQEAAAADADDSSRPQVAVPSAWEAYGNAWAKADGEAGSICTVETPAEWEGKNLELLLGAIDDRRSGGSAGGQVNGTDQKAAT